MEPEKLSKNCEKQSSPEYESVLEQLDGVLELSEEQQITFIKERIDLLVEGVKSGEISHIGNSVHEGFLGPDMKIRRNLMVDPLVMDDNSIYKELLDSLSALKTSWSGRSLREIMPHALQWTISKYFGNAVGGPDTERQNRDFYLDHTDAESQPVSIKEMQGKKLAVCAEKAAVAQNLLSFVGLESDLLAASSCRIPEDSDPAAHYYIIIHSPNGEMIYDPTNPVMSFDVDGKLVSVSPAIYQISEAQSRGLFLGEPILVKNKDLKISSDGSSSEIISTRIYGGINS